MDKVYRFTVDVEGDQGGRLQDTHFTRKGLIQILALFKLYHIKGLFFVSTEVLSDIKDLVKQIKEEGHEIGSHGHYHIGFKEQWRAEQDRKISETFLLPITGYTHFYYRAPKFSHLRDVNVYSNPRNHISLLRLSWFNQHLSVKTILYIHPFDIVGGDNPPNLFCRLWYSNPRIAYEKLIDCLNSYDGNSYL